jgi:hypothetical protein
MTAIIWVSEGHDGGVDRVTRIYDSWAQYSDVRTKCCRYQDMPIVVKPGATKPSTVKKTKR